MQQVFRNSPAVTFLGAMGAIATLLTSCSSPSELSLSSPQKAHPDGQSDPVSQTGTLEFRANGEDFVRQGFTSKDGWQIEFDHVYVTLEKLTAYSSQKPSTKTLETALAASTEKEEQEAIAITIPDAKTIDLAAGESDAAPILIQSLAVPAVHFKGLSWQLAPAPTGPAEGQVLQLVGAAAKDDEKINFKIAWDQAYAYRCGEFIGEQRKGIVKSGQTSDVEATFHFDHLFGDASVPETEEINRKALGFEPFAQMATAGSLEIDHNQLATQLSSEELEHLGSLFLGLGHVGEGHCDAEVVR